MPRRGVGLCAWSRRSPSDARSRGLSIASEPSPRTTISVAQDFYVAMGFRLIEVRPGAVNESRKLKPSIPVRGRGRNAHHRRAGVRAHALTDGADIDEAKPGNGSCAGVCFGSHMRLVTYDRGGHRRLGAILEAEVVDLPDAVGHPAFPTTLEDLVSSSRGTVMDAARAALQRDDAWNWRVPKPRILSPLFPTSLLSPRAMDVDRRIVGPDDPVPWPATAAWLDYDPMVAAVIGDEGIAAERRRTSASTSSDTRWSATGGRAPPTARRWSPPTACRSRSARAWSPSTSSPIPRRCTCT